MTPTSVRRRLTAALALIATLAAGTVAAGPAQASDNGVYALPYTPALLKHEHRESPWGPRVLTNEISWDMWRIWGFPQPRTAPPTEYVRYSWSPDIYAVTFFDTWLWARLTPEQYQRAGSPQARLAGHIEGTQYYAFGSDVFAELNGTAHRLSAQEWAASGFQPFFRNSVKLAKLTWSPGIADYSGDLVDQPGWTPITFEKWTSTGRQQPWQLPMLPWDRVCRLGGADLWYDGVTFEGHLTFAQWQAAGFPAPVC